MSDEFYCTECGGWRDHLPQSNDCPNWRSELSEQPPPNLPPQFKPPFFGSNMGKIFCKTQCGDTTVLDVRGWGYLTGTGGGLGMGEDEATKIQDQFEAWVCAALNAYVGHSKPPRQITSGHKQIVTPENPLYEQVISCPACSPEIAIKKDQEPDWASAFDPAVEQDNGAWIVRCPCGLRTGPYMTPESAIENWNRRGGEYLNNDGKLKFTYADQP